MNEVEKMYKNVGVSCKPNYIYNKVPILSGLKYPPFTAEKQIELIKWLAKRLDFGLEYYQDKTWAVQTQLGWDGYEKQQEHKNFCEAIAGLINNLWQDLTEEERTQIKNILE